MPQPVSSERGAILIQVAIAIAVLTGFSAFVADYGVMWLARAQAQNAADAGALAGGVARALDEAADPPNGGGPTYNSASLTAQAHQVWGTPATSQVSWDCPGYVTGSGCVRVDVFRDGTNGSSALPAFFAPLLRVANLHARATATAQARAANATPCLKPWAIADRWYENRGSATSFDRYDIRGNLLSTPPANDEYVPRTATSPGSGYLRSDVGTLMVLKNGTTGTGLNPGWFFALDLPLLGGGISEGGNDYRDNISSCNGRMVTIGETLRVATGNLQGPTRQGVETLVAQDPGARWNPATKSIDNSCAPGCAPLSPRLVVLPVIHTDLYTLGQGVIGHRVLIVNLMGFFVQDIDSLGTVRGYLALTSGELIHNAGAGATSSFLSNVALVR